MSATGSNNRPPRSRTPGARPRRVAGQPGVPRQVTEETVAEPAGEPVVERSAVELVKARPATQEPRPEPEAPTVAAARPVPPVALPVSTAHGRRGGAVATVVLLVLVVALLAVGAGELRYLLRDDPARISDARPVLTSELTVQSTVDKAAQALDTIFTTTPADYDAQVDAATKMMTGPFAEEFRSTKADVKAAVVAGDVATTIDVSGQGVVSATDQEVVALIFFTQTTQKGKTGGVVPVQFRAEVTMTNTSDGWLVSQVQTL